MTIPAPADQSQSVVDMDQVRAASKFGTIGFDAYVAMVLADSERLFRARAQESFDVK